MPSVLDTPLNSACDLAANHTNDSVAEPLLALGGARRVARRPTYELTSAEKDRLRGYYVRVRYNDEPVRIPGCRPAGKHYDDDETLCTLVST